MGVLALELGELFFVGVGDDGVRTLILLYICVTYSGLVKIKYLKNSFKTFIFKVLSELFFISTNYVIFYNLFIKQIIIRLIFFILKLPVRAHR